MPSWGDFLDAVRVVCPVILVLAGLVGAWSLIEQAWRRWFR